VNSYEKAEKLVCPPTYTIGEKPLMLHIYRVFQEE
jgi:hypothetical protein